MTANPFEALKGVREPARSNGHVPGYAVTFTDTKPPKLVLPEVPAHDDLSGLCAWITPVFRFDPNHPAIGAAHQGQRGPDGHVVIQRAGADSIRFEPASAVNTVRRLHPALSWQLLPTDGEPYGFRDEHARRIAYVLRLLCGMSTGKTEEQETAGIIGTFLSGATPVEGHTTYGTSPQRCEAARALQRPFDDISGRPIGPARYLIDENTGELAIRISDLQAAGRVHVGSSLPRGWLDARMEALGWSRVGISGYSVPGREGRRSGTHARCELYRGHLPHYPDEET